MTNWIAHNTYTDRIANIRWRGGAGISATKHFMLLCSSAVSRSDTLISIIPNEVLPATGYIRQNMSFSAGAYDAIEQRYELPTITVNFTAVGSDILWRSAIILNDASSPSSVPISAVDIATNRLSATAHSFVNSDRVLATVDAGGILFSPVTAGIFYYVKAVDANTIELYSDALLTSIVDLTTTGTAPYRLRNANGSIAYVLDMGATQTIAAGSILPVSFSSNTLNAGSRTGE